MKSDSQPLVSVILPCYNAEKFLRPAVDSMLEQTYRNLEILLIDDGSSDGTASILKSYAAADSRVKVITNERNLGLIQTLNKGITLSSGEFIARMDADDISHPDRITRLLKMFDQDPGLDLVSAGFWFIDAYGKVLRAVTPVACESVSIRFVSFFCMPIVHPCIVCRSRLLKQDMFDSGYIHAEDFELFSRLLLKGAAFRIDPDQLYYYRMNFQSVSYSSTDIQNETHLKITKRNIESYFGESASPRIHRILANRVNFAPTANELQEAFRKMDDYLQVYLQRERPGTKEAEEIRIFADQHKIDMLVQSVKQTGLMNSLRLITVLIPQFRLFAKPHGFRYMLEKYRMKSRSGKD